MGVWENVCIGAKNGALGMQETLYVHCSLIQKLSLHTFTHTHTHSLSTHLVLEDDPGFVLV